MYTCRECEHPINQATEICPYCGADLTEPIGLEAEEPAKKRTVSSILMRWAVLLAILSAALWGFLWFVLPEQSGDPAMRAEERAVEALREVRAALSAYAEAQGGAYPASLEALGDRARGPAQKALSEGYKMEYTPAPTGSDGRVRNYILLARPGNYGYRNFYADESGVLRATRENRPATAQDPTF
jgi:type II secretory pathway pseudopilin PulG